MQKYVINLITAHTSISTQSSNFVVFRLQPVYFLSLLCKSICNGYPFELHPLDNAVQMSTHNICFYKGNQKKLELCEYDTDAPAQGHPHTHAGILQKNEVEKRAITLIIIGRFYPKSKLTIFYDYILVYKI